MEKFYRILPSLPGLAGLYIRGLRGWHDAGGSGNEVVEVDEIITNQVIGDRDLKFLIPERSLWIGIEHLEDVADPRKEYSTASPFGEFITEGSFEKGDLHVAYTIFDNAITVTIFELKEDESQKTLFSQSFFKNIDQVKDVLAAVVMGETDVDDLTLILQEIQHG